MLTRKTPMRRCSEGLQTTARLSVPVAHILCVTVPVRIQSEANGREHWRVKAARVAAQRLTARLALGPDRRGPPPPYIITLTRIAPRLLDDDNLASGFKALRDGVADWLRIDDGDARLTWRYAQRKGAPKEYAAEVVIACEVEPT